VRRLLLAALSGLVLTALACAQAESRVPFDGVSLAGWEGDERYWTVADGAIVGRTTRERPLERTTYLVWTGGELRDFELSLRYRLTGGNSGVQFRSRVVGEHNVAGYQADLADLAGYTGQIYEQFGRNFLARRGENARVAATGKLEATRFASEEQMAALVRPGEWNELRIRAVGAHSEVWVNGTRTAELDDQSPLRASLSGVLALQLHSGEPMEVRFRDLVLRDLGGVHDAREHVDPQWIWTHAGATAGEEAWFAATIDPGGAAVQRATLFAVGDDGYEAYLNGELVAAGQGADRMQQVDVTRLLRAGPNHLALWGRNEDGLAAVLVSLVVDTPEGKRFFGTDARWHGASTEPADWTRALTGAQWGSVHSYGPLGTEPWQRPAFQVKNAGLSALAGDALHLPEGYAAELLYSVPRARQGSWVSLAFDPRGRGYASDQHGFLYAIDPAPPGADPATTHVERIELPLGEAQGLCWAFDALYVVVNHTERFESGLYRVRDTDGDGRLDHVEELQSFHGNTEHGPHAVVPGPDGASLYVVGGNEVDVPDDALAGWNGSYLPVGRLPAAVQRVDLTQFELTRESASGWIARTDRDGRDWELVAAGLRNAYDLAFDRDGELFAFDSDMEWDLGLPWYVPTRLLHVVERADFGFRQGSARWPTWFPDTLPAVVEAGRASPTGMLAGTELAFAARHRRAIFAGDWLKGRILAFHLEPEGASFRGEIEVFATGKPLPVTDLAAGPDGALYFTTGGRHVQSGLYRIVYRGEREADAPPTPAETEARAVREHVARSPFSLPGEPEARDRYVRHAFRSAYERSPHDGTQLEAPTPLAAADVGLAHARAGDSDQVRAVLERLSAQPIDLKDEELAATVLRTLEVALLRAGELEPELRARLAERLLAVFPCGQRDLDRELGVLLASLPEAEARFVPLALERLAAASTSNGSEAFHWALLLRNLRRGWTIEGRQQFFRWLQSADVAFDGGRAVPIFLRELRRDALATLTDAERTELGPLLEPGTDDATVGAPRPFVQAWRVEDLEPELAAAVEGERDLARGPRLLREARCLTCHRVDGRGQAVGPELDGLAGRFAPLDLLESILEPSREVPERYRDTLVTTADERVHVGRVVGEEDGALLLLDAYGARNVLRIPREEIVEQGESPLSPMPEGLLDTFTREELFDLVAYLLQDAD